MHSLFLFIRQRRLAFGITASACTQIVTSAPARAQATAPDPGSPARTPATAATFPDVDVITGHVHLFKPWHKET